MALQYYIGAQLMGRQDIAHLEGSDTFGRVHSGIPTQRPGPRAIHVVTSSPTSNPQTSNGEHVKGIESTAHVMALTD